MNGPAASNLSERTERGLAPTVGRRSVRASHWLPARLGTLNPVWQPPSGKSAEAAGQRSASGGEQQYQSVGATRTGPILVVDDDPAILDAVSEILLAEGYAVVTAPDGTEALRRFAELRPSLVLLDMRMPVVSGWDVARILRQRGVTVPVLVMTAAQDARQWAEQIDAAGYLAKPFDLDDLLNAVERLLRS